MKKLFTGLLLLMVFNSNESKAQLDSIYNQSLYRTYIVHKPVNYNPGQQYPLVFNLHGLNSYAASQQLYTQMDPVADTGGGYCCIP